MKATALLALVLAAVPAAAQTPPAGASPAPVTAQAPPKAAPAAPAPPPGEVEVAPIRCWWRTDAAEIRIGQRFGVTLTCSVVETRRLKVVANTTQLDPGAVQLTPFEVVSGVRREDIVSPPWRYFQFDYKVRLLSEGFFGQDVNVPPLNVTYNIQASGGGAQGRDQTYVLPALPVRVASIVPKDASDIRDASAEGFAAVDTRRSRATNATVAGGILFALAGVLVLFAGVRVFGRVRTRQPETSRSLSPALVLEGCHGALGEAMSAAARGGGWTPELVRAALAPLRLAAAAAMNRLVAQSPAGPEDKTREGQVKVRYGGLRPRWAIVSGAATPQSIERDVARGAFSAAPGARDAVERLAAALRACGAAAYGRGGAIDSAGLDAAVRDAMDAVRYLRKRNGPAARSRVARTSATLPAPSMSGERL